MTLGKSLLRSKQKKAAANKAAFNAIIELQHVAHTTAETAPKLQSVWETTDVQDLLAAADEREAGYAADRDVRVVVGGAVHVVTGDKVVPHSDARDWYGLSSLLDIPQRPSWDYSTTPQELQQAEKSMFLEWRRTLASAEEQHGVLMTPYEKNLEVWRQLWRVVERSDIILQIVDARNPLAFRCAGFERYVATHKSKAKVAKRSVLLLNKSDLLTEAQRVAWAKFFDAQGIEFFFFSARDAMEEMEAAKAEEAKEDAPPPKPQPEKKARRTHSNRLGAPVQYANPYALPSAKDVVNQRKAKPAPPPKPATAEELARDKRKLDEIPRHAVLSPTLLLDRLAVLRDQLGVAAGEAVMVGMVGFPNVGKSSTINAILESKRVVVSATPGKTKHFQTLTIPEERRIMLCDCPGLVFPTFSSTREQMVCDGILPVDTVRDYAAAIQCVVRRLPRAVFERSYQLHLDFALDVDDSSHEADFLLNQLSRRKGFMSDHDKPNRYPSAKMILKDYVDGRLVYVNPPPGCALTEADLPQDLAQRMHPAARLTADHSDEEWSDTDGDEEGHWDDLSSASSARGLSEDDEDDEDEVAAPARLNFFQTGAAPTVAEMFNAEHNSHITAPVAKRRTRKHKVNPQLDPDDYDIVRVTKSGEQQLMLDDDDDVVITGALPQQAKKKSKRVQRREAKRAGLSLKDLSSLA